MCEGGCGWLSVGGCDSNSRLSSSMWKRRRYFLSKTITEKKEMEETRTETEVIKFNSSSLKMISLSTLRTRVQVNLTNPATLLNCTHTNLHTHTTHTCAHTHTHMHTHTVSGRHVGYKKRNILLGGCETDPGTQRSLPTSVKVTGFTCSCFFYKASVSRWICCSPQCQGQACCLHSSQVTSTRADEEASTDTPSARRNPRRVCLCSSTPP